MSASYGRPAQLSWCNVCGQAVVTNASGPVGMGVRVDDDTIVHEHCFKCSSCHRRLSLETYRQDKLDKRFYCAKHHNGYNVVGASQSMPRGTRYSVNVLSTRSLQVQSESPQNERRRISTPASSSANRSPALTPSSPHSQKSFTSSLSTSSLTSPRSPLSSISRQRSPVPTPTAGAPSGALHSSSLSATRGSHSAGDAAHRQQPGGEQSSTSTSARLKASRAASQLQEARADLPSVRTNMAVQANDDEERHRSSSMPRPRSGYGAAEVGRTASARSTRSEGPLVSKRQRRAATTTTGSPRQKQRMVPTELDLSKQVSSGSSLGDNDEEENSASGAEQCLDRSFLHSLRQYKRLCLAVAEAMEEGGEGTAMPQTTPTDPAPNVAMGTGSVTPRQFKRLPIPELWSSASEASHFVQPVYGYYTEAMGSPKSTKRLSRCGSAGTTTTTTSGNRVPSPMLDRRSSRTALVSPEDVRDRYRLEPMQEDLYRQHFHGQEHWNFYAQNEPQIGACILSLKQEVLDGREQFRVLIRCQYRILHGLLPPACLLANRYNRRDVVEALKKEMGFVSRFRQALSPTAPDEILRLDAAFSSRQLKVGLLYVAPGQRGEEEIFNNAAGSRNFDDFMSEVGDRITLKDFDGFRGGLDAKHEQTGEHSLYRQWNGHEVMFHVSTLLPYSSTDRQQLQKKRHIGNDMVSLVFVDDMDTPFAPSCIRSHFLHTFIVVHCDSSAFPKRYRVDVVARDSVPQFGPPLAAQNVFAAGSQLFAEFLLTKLVNAYRASCHATKFHKLKVRTLTQMVKEATNGFALHELESTGHQRKMQRRGSWLPQGVARPPSPLRDSMLERFVDGERLSQDLRDLRTACKDLCDVNFIVGERREAVCAIKAVLAVRSPSFRDFFRAMTTAGDGASATPTAGGQDDVGANPQDAEHNGAKLPKRSAGSNRIKLKMPHKEKKRAESLGNVLASSAPATTTTSTMTSPAGTGSPIVRRKSRKGRKSTPTPPGGGAPGTNGLAVPGAETEKDEDAVSSSSTTFTDDMGIIQENDVLVLKAPPLAMIIHQLAKGIEVFQVNDFSLEAFSSALDFIHSGTCDVTPSNVVGLTCAAALMDVPALEKACSSGLDGLLRTATIMEVLKGAEAYYQRHVTAKMFITSVAGPFCEAHAKFILSNPAFPALADTTVTLLYQLKLDCGEVLKFEAALKWSHAETKRRCLDAEDYTQLLRPLVSHVDLKKISTKDLMHKVLPTGAVQEDKVLMALAYQADPSAMQSLEGRPTLDGKTLLQLALEREAMASSSSSTLSSPPQGLHHPSPPPRITEL